MNPQLLSEKTARQLAEALRHRGASVTDRDVRTWPVGRLRDAVLWANLYDRTSTPEDGFDLPALDHFLISREQLRRCRQCGCTEDNACLDPGMDWPCSWVAPDVCSACTAPNREVAR